ncbi:MAG: AgmX/PglI C-terminal domain-containing protein [Deltaproteobacteria bacterium]|nr:AgmX/PglI C-terminal domain-containing protein [Deltaproteobacteria bacterium]
MAARPEVVPMTESDVGAMSEYDVAKVMKDARAGLGDCIARAAELRAYVEGGLEVTLHVGKGGRVLNVLPTRSTLGDRDAERCILSHLAKQPWPAPVGGKVGTVRQEFDFAARGRAASTMPGGWLSAAGGRAKERLASCGEGPLSVTAYVDTDGKLLSAGAATTEPAVLGQLDCAARALAEVTFPSPGSWHGKVTITR